MYWSHSVNKNKLLKIWKYKEWSLKYMMFKFRCVNEYLMSHLYSIKIKFCLIILSLLHQWKNQWTQNKKDSRKSISTERRKEGTVIFWNADKCCAQWFYTSAKWWLLFKNIWCFILMFSVKYSDRFSSIPHVWFPRITLRESIHENFLENLYILNVS
jgi:hypothetical protein